VIDDADRFERKVQLTGGSTYTVSLPKAWATRHGIESGTPVVCHVRGSRLLVSPRGDGAGARAVTLDWTDDAADSFGRTVTAAYAAGCGTIRVRGLTDPAARRTVRDAVTGLVGVEIDEESDGTVVARGMLDASELAPERTLMRMEMTALSMHEDAVDALLGGDSELAARVRASDDEVDRLFALLTREFQRSQRDAAGVDPAAELTAFDYYAAARQLERVGDHAEKIADAVDRGTAPPGGSVAEDLRGRGKRARDLVRLALSGLLSDRESDALREVAAEVDTFLEEIETLDRELYELDPADGYLLGTVVESLRRTAEHAANLADVGLQATLRDAADSTPGDDADPADAVHGE